MLFKSETKNKLSLQENQVQKMNHMEIKSKYFSGAITTLLQNTIKLKQINS